MKRLLIQFSMRTAIGLLEMLRSRAKIYMPRLPMKLNVKVTQK
jgi:hypothetical protein